MRIVVAAVFAAFAFAIRVRGIDTQFWLLGDQVRDWGIALRPFHELPLVGPATHVGGYTIGPAYYWMMWGIRVVVGPWFDNLPHAGGYGQAAIESAADVLLLVAVWRRTESGWLALATMILIATSAFDVALSAIVWTSPVASALGKAAVALVLVGWHRKGVFQTASIVLLAWSAVHVYTGAIYVTVGVIVALLFDSLLRRDAKAVRRTAAVVAAVVLALQLPYLLHRVLSPSGPAMGAVTGGVWSILTGESPPEISKSLSGYAAAFNYIQVEPWRTPWPIAALVVCCAIVAVRYRRDPVVLSLVLLPQVLALVGYALFIGGLDHYYYLSVVPVALVAIALAVAPPTGMRHRQWVGAVLCVAAAALVPARLTLRETMHRLPEYRVLLDASRAILREHPAVRRIEAGFPLPPSTDPAFIYTILGGRIDSGASASALIRAGGDVVYR